MLAQLRPVSWATVVFTSAVTKQRVMQILDAASAASENHRRRISTATLNMVVKETVAWRAPPQVKNSYRIDNATLKYAKQTTRVLHPLPRNEEVAEEVDYDHRAAYFRQVRADMKF